MTWLFCYLSYFLKIGTKHLKTQVKNKIFISSNIFTTQEDVRNQYTKIVQSSNYGYYPILYFHHSIVAIFAGGAGADIIAQTPSMSVIANADEIHGQNVAIDPSVGDNTVKMAN